MQDWNAALEEMISSQIAARGVDDERVLAAMRRVPRHLFVDDHLQEWAYDDKPLPIGLAQTISQPFIVAFMTSIADVQPTDKVLEIGLGSGYQAAVLGRLAAHVYSVEIVQPLFDLASHRLKDLGYENITPVLGDGSCGLEEFAPFDVIMVTAAPKTSIPEPLKAQLNMGGRLVLPVGGFAQYLYRVTRTTEGLMTERFFEVRFVAMTGDLSG